MKPKEEVNLVIRISEYGFNNKSFTLKDLHKELDLDGYDQTYTWNALVQQNSQDVDPSKILHIFSRGYDVDTHQYALTPTALFNYNDHLEIVEARKAAKEAKRLSWIAIWITLVIGVYKYLQH